MCGQNYEYENSSFIKYCNAIFFNGLWNKTQKQVYNIKIVLAGWLPI